MPQRGGTTVVCALVGALLAVVPGGGASGAEPPFCGGLPADELYTWDGSVDTSWGIAANWDRNEVPNDDDITLGSDATPDTHTTYVCIPAGMTVVMDEEDLSNNPPGSNQVAVQAFYLGAGASLSIPRGVGLFAHNDSVDSVAAIGSEITVEEGSLGGEGTIRIHGTVSVSGTSTFASALISASFMQPVYEPTGRLVVETDGELSLPSYGVNLSRGYAVEVHGETVMQNNGFLAVSPDSRMDLRTGGTYELGGVGGFYVDDPASTPLVSLVNAGQIVKSGTGTAIIESDYAQAPSGSVRVTGGTLAFTGGNTYSAEVEPGQQLSTADCAPHAPTEPCVPETDPSNDSQSVGFTVPNSDLTGALVNVREEALGIFTAHADGLDPAGDPATIEIREGAALLGTSNPADVEVVHVDDRGVERLIPACDAGGRAAGSTNCVDRLGTPGSSRTDGSNVFMVVKTTQTSRYICRKEDLVPPVVLVPAVAPPAKLGKPITLTTTVNELARIEVSGTIRTKRPKVKRLGLSGAADVAPGQQATVVLKLTKAQKDRIKAKRPRKGKVVLTVTATDSNGNKTVQTVPVKLR